MYGRAREEIAGVLGELVAMPWLAIEGRDQLTRAIDSYASVRVDFIDAYNAEEVRRRGQSSLYSYDLDFERLGLVRLTPMDVLSSLAGE